MVTGDHPDPSLLRGGNGWYATSTSGDWLPAFPLLWSADLAHWRQVGSVLPRRPAWADGDFWAPELVRRGRTVFAYYAAKARSGRRCLGVATAGRVRGPYRDHGPMLCSPVGEIDPLPVTDEHDADWLVWKRDGNSRGEPTPIVAAPLAPGGVSLAAPPQELFRADAPGEGGIVEAPALLRSGGMFYLLYSAGRCCGRHCTYATGVARSPSLLGPWEKRPAPILAGDGTLRCPGHVGVARGPDGQPVVAYHAYVRGDPSNRQLLTARLGFDAEGWPVVAGTVDTSARPEPAGLEFDQRLGDGWEWPAGPAPAARVAAGALELGPGALTRQTGTDRFTATTVVTSREASARPGLAVMAQHGNAVGVELRNGRAAAWRAVAGRRSPAGALRLPPGRPVVGGPLELRVFVGSHVRLAVKARGRWRAVGGPQPLPRWAGGAHAGLSGRGPGGAGAQFASLAIAPR